MKIYPKKSKNFNKILEIFWNTESLNKILESHEKILKLSKISKEKLIEIDRVLEKREGWQGRPAAVIGWKMSAISGSMDAAGKGVSASQPMG